MSSTPSQSSARETAAIRSVGGEQTHLGRMAALYAWILVTLVIFALGTMLAGIEDTQAVSKPGQGQIQRVGAGSAP